MCSSFSFGAGLLRSGKTRWLRQTNCFGNGTFFAFVTARPEKEKRERKIETNDEKEEKERKRKEKVEKEEKERKETI